MANVSAAGSHVSYASGDQSFFGHPRGLAYAGATELWERISFHGMQALLVLYMVEQLLLPGHIERITGFEGFRAAIEAVRGPLSTQALASQIFGLYVGFVYLTPILGGLLGDRVIGRRRAVALGALLMTAGHFCMAFEQPFLLALLLLICGAGALRGNLISQVGDLYAKDDRRRAAAFQIYYILLNTGAFVAPLITGLLARDYGWHYGFGFAGVGMLAGLLIYLYGNRYLPPDRPRARGQERERLSASERRVVFTLVLLIPLMTLFWIAQAQVWNSYNLWARDHLDLGILGWQMPVPWLQSIDSLAVMLLVPVALIFWRWQAGRGREPDELVKIGTGCLIFGAALVWLAGGQWASPSAARVPLMWALGFHLLSNIGYVYAAPTVIGLFARTAPASVNAMMVGVYYLAMFAGSVLSGWIGGFYERLSPAEFWLLHAAIIGAGGVLILAFAPWLRRSLSPRREPELPAAGTLSTQSS